MEISFKDIQSKKEDTYAREIQNQQRLFIELSQENEKQKIFIDEMRDEMHRRKETQEREILRLKQSLSDIQGGENDSEFTEKDQRLQKYAEMQLMELENSSFDFHQRNVYRPEFDNDPLDYAVAEVLSSLQCPVRIEIERLGPGEYQMDRKLKLRLINGDVMGMLFFFLVLFHLSNRVPFDTFSLQWELGPDMNPSVDMSEMYIVHFSLEIKTMDHLLLSNWITWNQC